MRTAVASLVLCLLAMPALAEGPKRVVSVGGAVTEIVYALGAGDLVVGSDTTSYFPPDAAETPKVGYQRALSAEGILSLNPDIVLLSNESGPPPVLAQIENTGLSLVRLVAGRNLDDVRDNIRTIGDALGLTDRASAMIEDLNHAEKKLKKAVADGMAEKRVLFILQHGGGAPMVAGTETAADSVIALAGARNAVSGYTGYKPMTPEAAVSASPEVILVTTQGLEAAGGAEALGKLPGLALTPAVRNGRVIAMDALLLLGFGPRTVEAAMTLHQKIATP